MKITFIGATHEVTGSKTLIEVAGKYYLIDCGMEQGKDVFENVPLPVNPADIEAVFITHAHIDHSGMLPKLVKDGFKGPIFTTEVTANLCDIMLRDSAHIQMQEAEWKTRKSQRAGGEIVDPVYDLNDADAAIRLLRRCDYNKRYSISENISVRFTDVGHLLGSAAIEIWMSENDVTKKIVFSGDIGNTNRPLVRDPQPVKEADYLVIESTYGNRLHEPMKNDMARDLAAVIQRALDRGGNLVIPAFAVGRTQELLYAIREIKQNGYVEGHDDFPVYLDSPLAVDATAIFMQCPKDYLDNATLDVLESGVNPIWFTNLHLAVTSEDSKNINFDPTPKVIIAASGMCDAGRIRHHLKHNLWRRESLIYFVGYQSNGTLGRSLVEGAEEVTLFGEKIAVNAEIAITGSASGHADQKGLLKWADSFEKRPELVFVNHGEDSSAECFRGLLESELGYDAVAPFSGTEYDLMTGEPIVITEGIPVPEKKSVKKATGGAKKQDKNYRELVNAADDLSKLAASLSGHSNAELSKLTQQIRKLIDAYK